MNRSNGCYLSCWAKVDFLNLLLCQVEDAPGDEQQGDDEDDRDIPAEDNAIEMSEDFEGKLHDPERGDQQQEEDEDGDDDEEQEVVKRLLKYKPRCCACDFSIQRKVAVVNHGRWWRICYEQLSMKTWKLHQAFVCFISKLTAGFA